MPSQPPSLSDLGEDALVARLTALLTPGRDVLVGPGDDCAVVESPRRGWVDLLKTDALVEGVHYASDTPPAKVGRKAVARVLSDFAAMAGTPRHLLVTVALPPDRSVRWAESLYRGMDRCAAQFGCAIVGGETSSVPEGAPAFISVAATGEARRSRLVTRAGGRPGDALFVTGRLGGSLGGRHLTFTPRLVEARWLAARHRVHAMMDLSDGLAKDLPRLAAASGCGFVLDREAVPRARGATIEQALGDGEDYELLFAVAPQTTARLVDAWKTRFPRLKLTRVGRLTARGAQGSGGLSGGWDHFKA